MRLYIYTIIIFFFSFNLALGQQNRYDARVGIHAGVINYYGDLNSKTFSPNDRLRDYDFDFLSFGISVEKNLSPAWAVRLQYTKGQFIANDRAIKWDGSRDFDNSNDARSLNAKTDIDELGLMFTYYTDNGKLFSKNAFLSPYVSFGLGITLFDVFADLEDENGNWYNYWSDNTIRNLPEGSPNAQIIEQDGVFETNVSDLNVEKDYSNNVFNIPFGAGLKFRLTERFNLNLDYTLRYVFTDYLDDVSGNYRDTYTSELQAYAANPTNTIADQRGNDDGNDWYGFASVSLHYSFGKKSRSFNAPIIYSTTEYEAAVLAPTISTVDTIASLPLNSLSVLRDSLRSAPEIRKIPQRNITNVDGKSVRRTTRDQGWVDERRMQRMERRDTLDSLSYLVEKQRLENELFRLRMTSPNPDVKLRAQSDSLKAIERFTSEANIDEDTARMDSIYSEERRELDRQLAALDRQLQQMVNDSTNNDDIFDDEDADSTDSLSAQYEAAYNNRIDSLEQVIESLRKQKDDSAQAATKEEQILIQKRMKELAAQRQALQADTSRSDSLGYDADSLAIAELEQRYNALEQEVQRDQQAQSQRVENNDEQERINALEREVQSLRQQRDNARYNANQRETNVVNSEERARIASLEREIDRLQNKRNLRVNPVVTPVISSGNEADTEYLEEDIDENEQKIDSLQRQIAALEADNAGDTLSTAPSANVSSRDSIDAQVAQMRQEINDLRANIIAMDEDKAAVVVKVPETVPAMPTTEVFFNVGSSTLSNSDKNRILALTKFINKYPQATVLLKGYTDPTGSPELNLMLSKKRAESVKKVLVEEGISSDRVNTEFFGADSSVSTDLAYGRRVEIVIK